jgi:protoheme ferro-lyase
MESKEDVTRKWNAALEEYEITLKTTMGMKNVQPLINKAWQALDDLHKKHPDLIPASAYPSKPHQSAAAPRR